MLRRLFSLFSAFSVLFFFSVPVFATGTMPGGSFAGIPVGVEVELDVVEFADFCRDDLRYFYNSVRHWLDEDICPYAPQASGSHNFVPRRTMVDGQIGKYYVCEYCGKAYGDALEEAYDEYVETLPTKQVKDGVSFRWVPLSISDFVFSESASEPSFYVYFGSNPIVVTPSHPTGEMSNRYGKYVAVLSFGLGLVASQSQCDSKTYMSISYFSLRAPRAGYYELMSDASIFPYGVDGFYGVGNSISFPTTNKVWDDALILDWPQFWVTPLDNFFSEYDMSADTRVSGCNVSDSGTGSYGYVQDGQLYQSTVGTIYNETTNIYQNPVTGETGNVTNWTYDYGDRSYTLTMDEGETVTVTYGDTNVTINDGGTTYNVYYLTEHEDIPEHHYTSSVTLAPTCTGTGVRTYTCTDADCGDTYTEIIPATGHSHQFAVTMPPTCVNTGVKTFTCSVCGDSYTQSIPATGHTWTVTKTVPNQYDGETGELTQAGYTLYECSTCGEQYRIDAASSGETLPSPSTGGTSIGTGNSGGEALTPDIDSSVGRGFLATIAHGLTEDLPEVLELISEWFKTVPALYNGYSKFLAASFAWMPPDCVMLLTFSVGMVTVIAICRAMFRR